MPQARAFTEAIGDWIVSAKMDLLSSWSDVRTLVYLAILDKGADSGVRTGSITSTNTPDANTMRKQHTLQTPSGMMKSQKNSWISMSLLRSGSSIS
jgi:hypothetical protein